MKKITIAIILILLVSCAGLEKRTDCKISVMGITADDFRGRDWRVVALGVGASFLVHEASHIIYAEINDGGHFDWDRRVCIMEDYHNQSHSDQQMFHRAGFLGQLAVGGILTAIPTTRHSDFTLGFNTFTTINTGIYTITGGRDDECSDIGQLDNGKTEGSIYTLGAGVLTYINLDKAD